MRYAQPSPTIVIISDHHRLQPCSQGGSEMMKTYLNLSSHQPMAKLIQC